MPFRINNSGYIGNGGVQVNHQDQSSISSNREPLGLGGLVKRTRQQSQQQREDLSVNKRSSANGPLIPRGLL